MAFAETQQLVVQLDLKGNFKAGLGQAARALQSFDRSTSNTQRSLSKFGNNIEKGVKVGLAATAAGFLGVVKAAADYESAFAGVRKTVSATEPQLQELSNQFRELSKQIPISASELARLGEAGGALGVPTKDLKEFVRVTALLGVTTNLSADEAADALGVLGNVLHLTGQQYSQFASSLVALGNAGASTEKDIVAIAERAGAAGKLIGVSTEQILGFSSAVASLGIEAEAGGTAIQKFFIDTAKFVAAGGKDLNEIAKIAGTTGKAFQKAFKEDAGAALQEFLRGLGKLPQAQQLKVLEDLGFNDARITRTLLGLANNTKLVSDQMKVANDAFAQNTALTKEAQQRFNTFDSQLQITKNTLTDMAITIGSKLLPKITPLLKRLNEFVGSHQADIERFGDQLAAGFERFADALQKVDWAPFIDGLKITSDIAKTVITAFRSLPEDLQKLVVAGFALNKVTGGLGTSLVKDLGGVILDKLANQRGSSPANPLFVSQVGPGGGPSGGGGIGGFLGVLGLSALGAGIVTAVGVPVINRFSDELAQRVHEAEQGLRPIADVQAELAQALRGAQAGHLGDARIAEIKALQQELTQAVKDGIVQARTTPGSTLLDRGGREQGGSELAGKIKDDIAIAKAFGSVIGYEFKNIANALNRSNKPSEIRNAIKEALDLIGRGRGSVDSTKNVLAGLKNALKNTHDPKLQSELRAAIRKVEAKIPGREFAAKQIAKAEAIFRSSEKVGQKIRDLQGIERSLRDHGLPKAANEIKTRIDRAKAAQVAAALQTTRAVNNKKLAVTIPVSITNRVSVQETIKTQTTFKKFGAFVQ